MNGPDRGEWQFAYSLTCRLFAASVDASLGLGPGFMLAGIS